MFALVKKEVRSFLSLLIGYIVISVFLILMGLFLWVFPFTYNIPESGYARLDPLFDLAPWVFLFLIPAITMRSFAEERRNGTIELLFTKPLTDTQIILSKYIGGLVLVIFSLIPTLIYYISVNALGDPPGIVDNGGTFGSYIGLLMIGATFVSVGIFCSSLSQNQVVAFILAVFLCFFLYLGFELMSSWSQQGKYMGMIRNIGIYEHYSSIKRGVVDTRDILYFLTVITAFILFTKFVLEQRKGPNAIYFFITVAIVVVINFIGSLQFFRFDLTEDKIHSLSPATIEFLESKTTVKSGDKTIKGNIDIKVYLAGDLPADLKYLEKAVKEKLDEMRAFAGSRLNYEFIDPYADEDPEVQMKMLRGISEFLKVTELQYEEDGKFQSKYVFPGATISFEGKPEVPVQFFVKDVIFQQENQLRPLVWAATDQLEFKLVDGIRKAKESIRPNIAILQGHGEADQDDLHYAYGKLSEFYNVKYITIDEKINALNEYQGLLVVQPDSAFSEKDKFVIDQFVMRGGKVAWFVDPMHVYTDTLFRKGQTFGLSKDLNLDDQLFTYGVRLNKDIVIDKSSTPIDIPGYPGNFVEWPFFPYAYPKIKHPIVRNINPVKFEYASSIDLVGDTSAVKKLVLLTSSEKSAVYKAPVRINYGIVNVEPFSVENLQPYKNLAVLLEGKFKSVFRNRLSEAFTTSKDYKFLETSSPTRMLVVSDGDVIKNYYRDSVYLEQAKMFTKQYLKLEFDQYQVKNRDGSPKYIYGNAQFLLNAIDYLMGDESLIELRQRTLTIRKLDDMRVMREKSYWQFVNIGIPLIILTIFGLTQHFIRRYRYSR